MSEQHKHEDEVRIVEEVIEVAITRSGTGEETVVIAEEILIEIEDIEHHGKHGTIPRRAKSYRIVIDKQPPIVHRHEMTGSEILKIVGKTPDKFTLTEKLHGGKRVRIEADDVVVFAAHGVERFETAPKSASNGEAAFGGSLTADDMEYLGSIGCGWRVVSDGGGHALILSGYHLPAAFSPSVVELMVRIPPFYPAAKLDMFNTFPPVMRADGRPLPCLSLFPFQGQTWQQWSRHRASWDPNVDCVATHMALVENALAADAM